MIEEKCMKRRVIRIFLLMLLSVPVSGLLFAESNMNIKLTTSGGREVTISMDDNATSRDFVSQLPVTLDFSDYARTEKVADPVSRLTTDGAPSGYKPSAGDLTLYAPWGNLALFYKGFSYSNGLVYMGRVVSGEQYLKDLEGPVKIEIDK